MINDFLLLIWKSSAVWIITLHVLGYYLKSGICAGEIKEITVAEGIPIINLNCEVFSQSSSSHIQWLFNSKLLIVGNGSEKYSGGSRIQPALTIHNVTRHDRGKYTCNVTTSIEDEQENELENTYLLHVKYPPKCSPSGRAAFDLHSSFSLKCGVEPDEKNVSFTWRYNDTSEIKNIVGLSIISNGTRSKLIISFSQPENYKDYYCYPHVDDNDVNQSCKYHIQQSGKPEPPRDCEVQDVDQTTVIIHCEKGFNGGYLQAFIASVYFNNKTWTTLQEDTPDFIIQKLKPQRNFTVKIIAQNKLGHSEEVIINVQTTDKDKLTSLISGIVIGAIMIVLVLTGFIIFFFFYRKRKINKRSSSFKSQLKERIKKTSQLSTISKLIDDDDERNWQFHRDCVEILEMIGENAFSNIYKAVVKNDEEKGIIKMKCALRIPKDIASLDRKEVEKEVIILRTIPPHSGVIHLFGYIIEPEYFAAVLEWFHSGTLHSYLLQLKQQLQDLFETKGSFEGASSILDPKVLLYYAHQIAGAMSHISQYKCLHRDLASRNVFIGAKGICKIADFGYYSDIITKRQNDQKNKNNIPIRWMSLESLNKGEYTEKSDVWSFGILCWEILHLGTTPYPDKTGKETIKAIQNSFRLKRPNYCSNDLYSLIEECWISVPDRRPRFEQLSNELYHLAVKASQHLLLSELNECILSQYDVQLDMNEKF